MSKLALFLAIMAVVLIVANTARILVSEFDRSRDLGEAVRESYERRAQLQAVLSMHQDIETGQRGYVLTGDEHFLEPYSTAKSRIALSLVELDSRLGNDVALKRNMLLLSALSARKLRLSEQAIAFRHGGKTRRSISVIAEGTGKHTMDGIRRVVAEIDDFESKQLGQRLEQSRRATVRAETLSMGLQCLLLLLVAVAGWGIARNFRDKQHALRKVQDLNARQAAIFDAAKDGIIVINPSGSIESLNRAAARTFGYADDELVRRDVGVLFEVAPDQGQVETFLKRLQRRRRSDAGAVQEIWARRRDGSTFPADVSVSPVSLAGGVRYVAIVRDITERKQVDQMKTEFVSTVSHELRTPLTSIAGALGLLKGGAAGTLPGPSLRLVEVAHGNSQRLIRLVNDILDIEKIESGSIRFEVRPVALIPLLTQAVEANGRFAADQRVNLIVSPGHDSPEVIADPDRLAQVVTNLISNAVKFSPEGASVRISVARLDRRYRISVADRGPGIPQDFRDRIFNRFAQADSSDTRRRGGTGLGLSIVKEIVTRLGGSVGFEDRAGGGTIFHVDLPAAEAPPLRHEARRSDDAAPPRVLHVEDDPDVARVTARAFGGRASLQNAATLSEARWLLKTGDYDVVILDVGLPDGAGTELVPEIGGRSGGKTHLVIYSAEDVSPDVAAGVDAVLVKARASLDDLVGTVVGLAGCDELRRAHG